MEFYLAQDEGRAMNQTHLGSFVFLKIKDACPIFSNMLPNLVVVVLFVQWRKLEHKSCFLIYFCHPLSPQWEQAFHWRMVGCDTFWRIFCTNHTEAGRRVSTPLPVACLRQKSLSCFWAALECIRWWGWAGGVNGFYWWWKLHSVYEHSLLWFLRWTTDQTPLSVFLSLEAPPAAKLILKLIYSCVDLFFCFSNGF